MMVRIGQAYEQVPTTGVKRAIERAMYEQDWQDAGAGWQGKDDELRLVGWSRQRRIVVRATCKDNGGQWKTNIHLTVAGDKLTWVTERRNDQYVRCPSP